MADTEMIAAAMRASCAARAWRRSYASSSAQIQSISFDETDTYPQENTTMHPNHHRGSINTEGMLYDDAIKLTDEHAKALRKRRKAAKKAAARDTAASAERARVRQTVKSALEHECAHGASPVAAAVELHRLFG